MEEPVSNFGKPKSPDNKLKDFSELIDRTLQGGGKSIPLIEYNLPYPKEDFLRFLATERNVLLHGSSNLDLEMLEPKQANDREKSSGNKNAVYCVADPVLPIFYAIRDRSKIEGLIESGVGKNPETGELEYKFRMPQNALDKKPWSNGAVYIFESNKFHPEKNDNGESSGEWISEVPVKPIAKLEVGPEDFRFLDKVEGEDSQERIHNPDIASEIERMTDVDQEMRERSGTEEDFWDDEVDKRNTERMKEIIAKIGFPSISKVGKEGSHNAWLLIQHADLDVEFQKMCLELMKGAPAGEVEKRDIAYLEDRIKVNQKQGQIYGTQFTQEGGKHIPQPIEDEDNVDIRRAKMGMDTLADQIALMYKKYPFTDEK